MCRETCLKGRSVEIVGHKSGNYSKESPMFAEECSGPMLRLLVANTDVSVSSGLSRSVRDAGSRQSTPYGEGREHDLASAWSDRGLSLAEAASHCCCFREDRPAIGFRDSSRGCTCRSEPVF